MISAILTSWSRLSAPLKKGSWWKIWKKDEKGEQEGKRGKELNRDHASKHGTKGPHIKRVVIILDSNQQLGALKVARGDPHLKKDLEKRERNEKKKEKRKGKEGKGKGKEKNVVILAGVVKLGKTPINKTDFP